MEREPLRGLLPYTGQTAELVDQTLERRGKVGHGKWEVG
jgi:hypothetical protein